MNEFSYRLIHDRPNQKLRLVRYSTGQFGYTIKADIDLNANVRIERQDGGGMERTGGRRTFVLIWGEGDKQKVELTANSKLEVTIEDETTLVKLDDGTTAYNFAFVEATPELAGDHLEQILRRIVRQTGFRSLRYGAIVFDDAATVKHLNVSGDLTEYYGGPDLAIPADAVGASMSLEGADDTNTIRVVTSGSQAPAASVGHLIYDKDIIHIGKTPETPDGDVLEVQGEDGFRGIGATNTGDTILHITFWGLQ